MTIRIHHPEHGWHHVYTAHELERHVALGWQVDVPKEEAKTEEPKKRGRKPKAKE